MSPQSCIIFDVDGTLVDSSGFEDALYTGAVRDVIGDVDIRPDWAAYKHATDTGILLEICRRHGVAIVDTVVRVREHFGERVAAHFAAGGACPPTSGAVPLFDRLSADPRHAVGIATGGWGHTAAMKLAHAGFDVRGVAIASSDDHHTRVGIMQRCRARLPATARTIYVGDGEWDRDACGALGWEFVGVGARLRGRCAVWAPDLASPALDAALGARRV